MRVRQFLPGSFSSTAAPNQKSQLSPVSREPIADWIDIAAKNREEEIRMRSVLLWLVGVPIPIILLLALCTHHF